MYWTWTSRTAFNRSRCTLFTNYLQKCESSNRSFWRANTADYVVSHSKRAAYGGALMVVFIVQAVAHVCACLFQCVKTHPVNAVNLVKIIVHVHFYLIVVNNSGVDAIEGTRLNRSTPVNDRHSYPSPCTSRTSQRLAVGLCALPYIPLSAPLRRTLFCYSFYFRRISAFFLHNQRKTANFAPCDKHRLAVLAFRRPWWLQPSRTFYVNQKKELCNNGELRCYHLLYYYTTKVRLFFDIYKHFGNFFMRKISIYTHIDIYQLSYRFIL